MLTDLLSKAYFNARLYLDRERTIEWANNQIEATQRINPISGREYHNNDERIPSSLSDPPSKWTNPVVRAEMIGYQLALARMQRDDRIMSNVEYDHWSWALDEVALRIGSKRANSIASVGEVNTLIKSNGLETITELRWTEDRLPLSNPWVPSGMPYRVPVGTAPFKIFASNSWLRDK